VVVPDRGIVAWPGNRTEEPATARYEIRIRGRVGDELASYVHDMSEEVLPVETVLRGEIVDQAALHGMLDRLEQLGLELVEVRQLPRERGEDRRRAPQ
jgi:hypothetical protein